MFTYDDLGRVDTEDITIAGVVFPSIQRDYALLPDSSEVSVSFPSRDELRIYDGRGRLETLMSDALPDAIEFDWAGDLYTGRVQGMGPFREVRKINDFGEIMAQLFSGASDQSWKDPNFTQAYCQGFSSCSSTLMDVSYKRDGSGRVDEKNVAYEFPRSTVRTTPSFNSQRYTYDARGHLGSFVEERNSVGQFQRPVSTFAVDYKRGVHGSVVGWETSINDQEFNHGATRFPDGSAESFHPDPGVGAPEYVKYDDRGMIARLGRFGFVYDQWHQLTSVQVEDEEFSESYLYDFAGRLVATINRDDSQGASVDFLILDGEKLVEQWRGAASQYEGGDQLELRSEYFWGPLQQQMVAARTVESGFNLVFPLTDALQSIIGIWNEDQVRITEYAEYDAEGRISVRSPDDTEDCSQRNLVDAPCHMNSLPHFGFTGAFRSTTTGLYRFGARWYSPRFGQFMGPDPLWYVDSFDVYGYAAFDPVNRWDPSGMASKGMGDSGGRGLWSRLVDFFGGGSDSEAEGEYEESLPGTDLPGANFGNPLPLRQGPGPSYRPPLPSSHNSKAKSRVSRPEISRNGNDIDIHLTLYFTSNVGRVSDEVMERVQSEIQNQWSGQFGRYRVNTTVTALRGQRTPWAALMGFGHRVIITGLTHRIRRGVTAAVRKGVLRMGEQIPAETMAHEIGHLFGLGDRYEKGGDTYPGWEGNIMGLPNEDYSRSVWEVNILNILEFHGLTEPGDYQ
ncbi:hypothetical protein DL240_03895 [Lujinxingia litoralis]|uniref:RHS repeat-associated core domain-containing protein n=1 Tax=Lujinxingia litoralis TaxID=2211119 RepID=A0A328CB08_9DELT|nr:RHS repeat-associated core domain-containing protein [Lujinxingia litoralis]RAL25362.1 hypothetical protein DL240_03895 [Lujinxingia litoralis]